jgi:hypothetical protein
MTQADRLLIKIRKACTLIGRDPRGRAVIQLVLDQADAELLMASETNAAGSDSGGDDSPYGEPRVSVCWLESA